MSSSMNLEEKFEVVMKNNQAISASNQELKDQNKYKAASWVHETKAKDTC